MKRTLGLIAIVSFLALAACAEAPPESSPPPVAANLARMYFYRLQEVNQSQSWTSVSLNENKVGDSAPGTFFYRDVAPGTYLVKLRSERNYDNQFQTVTVEPGTTTYVKIFLPEGLGQTGMGNYWDGRFTAMPRLLQQNIFADQIVSSFFAQHEMAALRPAAG